MRYLGGKSKIAKKITAAILAHTDRRGLLIEPFCGGGAMTAALAPHFDRVDASDIVEDLILMWQALQDGWQPPRVVTEAEHATIKHAPPSALRAFILASRSAACFCRRSLCSVSFLTSAAFWLLVSSVALSL